VMHVFLLRREELFPSLTNKPLGGQNRTRLQCRTCVFFKKKCMGPPTQESDAELRSTGQCSDLGVHDAQNARPVPVGKLHSPSTARRHTRCRISLDYTCHECMRTQPCNGRVMEMAAGCCRANSAALLAGQLPIWCIS
jgi:hypothetical protein